MVQFGASESAKIATFPGTCPVGRSLSIEEGQPGVAGTEIVKDVRPQHSCACPERVRGKLPAESGKSQWGAGKMVQMGDISNSIQGCERTTN